MNILDRVIGYVSPTRGAQRARARHLVRIYEGAASGRRGTSWKALHSSANAELQYSLRPLRDRARDLVRNTSEGARMLDVLTAHAVGDGILPVSRTGDDKLDQRVHALWDQWVEQSDVTGVGNFYSMQVLGTRSMIESGETVCRFIDQPLESRGSVPFRLQLLEADYIDQFRDGIYGDPATLIGVQKSRLGVGLGEFDRRMGLWLWPYHPGEITTINMRPLISEFVASDDVIHMFKELRPGQVRGVPWMAPILTTAREFADFRDAVNVKARVEACFTAFITNDDQTAPLLDSTGSGVDPSWDQANPGAMVTSLEPGMIKELRSGQTVSFAQPTSNTQIDPMLLYNMQAMAAGVGLTYDQLSGDLRRANYSSLRAGKLDFWKLISQLQQHVIIPQFCQRVRSRFISRAILADLLPNRREGYPCDWVVPAREAVDPGKDLDAEKNEVRSGRITPQQFIASKGNDWRKNLDDFKAFFDLADEKKIVLDIDPRNVDQGGKQPPASPEEPVGADNIPKPKSGDDGDAAASDQDDDE